MLKDILLVGAGGFIGSAARYAVSFWVGAAKNGFPWATFAINILGCFLIGFIWGWTTRCSSVSSQLTLFLSVGICGGFTTFSTFSKESLALFQSGSYLPFTLYILGSVVLGIAAVAAAYAITK